AVAGAQRVAGAAYSVVDKAAQPFYMGYDLLQCAYVGVYGAYTGEYFEPNWVSDLAKNAPADVNDKEAWERYFVQAELDNLKDGAASLLTFGVGKAAGPVLCKLTTIGCFPAGTPVPVEHGCKAVEDVCKGDVVLMRPEHDPTAPPVLGRVADTFKTHA